VDPRARRQLARYGAPAAFLAAATVAVLLIKAGLAGSGAEDATPTVGALPTGATTTTAPTTRVRVTVTTASSTPPSATTTAGGDYYTVQSGDTLGGIAAKYDTTVEELVRLNPGIAPTALHVGQKIRVG
jgi:LysM repeat protein